MKVWEASLHLNKGLKFKRRHQRKIEMKLHWRTQVYYLLQRKDTAKCPAYQRPLLSSWIFTLFPICCLKKICSCFLRQWDLSFCSPRCTETQCLSWLIFSSAGLQLGMRRPRKQTDLLEAPVRYCYWFCCVRAVSSSFPLFHWWQSESSKSERVSYRNWQLMWQRRPLTFGLPPHTSLSLNIWQPILIPSNTSHNLVLDLLSLLLSSTHRPSYWVHTRGHLTFIHTR